MAQRNSFFDVTKPGEYGKEGKDKDKKGFIIIQHPSLGKQRIFVASKCFVENLRLAHKIDKNNVASMVDKGPYKLSPRYIPEEHLEGRYGLNMFVERLGKIIGTQEDVIICCAQGVNRSPVAAVIFLIYQGMAAEEARNLVTSCYQSQRCKDFELNERGNYTEVLHEAYAMQENKTQNSMNVSY